MLDFENLLRIFCNGAYLASYFYLKKHFSKFIDLSQETVTADFGTINSRVIQDFVAARPSNH